MGFNGQGTIRGGATGAAAGAQFGPKGAIIGGALGALGGAFGLFGGGGPQYEVNQTLGMDQGIANQSRTQLSRLQEAALGRGQSISGMAYNQARESGRAQLESQAISDRRNPALARRNAMIQGGVLNARLGQQLMAAKLQEKQQAEMALAQAINAARQADLQRGMTVEQLRAGQAGRPTEQDKTMNVLASTLPMMGQMSAAGQSAPQQTQSAPIGGGLSLMPQADPTPGGPGTPGQPRWVPTGPYGQGQWVY
jgi:hypothetical protein